MIPMYNHDDERYLLGGLLQDAALQRELPMLPDDLMDDPQHQTIFAAMKAMQQKKLPIEILSLGNFINAEGHQGAMDMIDLLNRYYKYCPTTANIRHYIDELTTLCATRSAYRMATAFCHRLSEGEELSVCVNDLRTDLREAHRPKGKIVRMNSVASAAYEYVEKKAGGEIVGMATGIPDYDRYTGGLFGGELTVIGARPAVGKSAFGMEIALNVARRGGKVLVCSREMNDLQYGIRLASNLSGLNGMSLKNGTLGDNQWEPLNEAFNAMASLSIAFTFEAATVEELQGVLQHEADIGGVELLIVDYLQLMGTFRRSEKRYLEVGAVSRALKAMAMEFRIPVIALAQVGRARDASGGRRAAVCPVMSELRESGNIEQDADTIVFLHHPEVDSDPEILDDDQMIRQNLEQRGRQYVIARIDKQRMGPKGSFGLVFDPAHMHFTCLERSPS